MILSAEVCETDQPMQYINLTLPMQSLYIRVRITFSEVIRKNYRAIPTARGCRRALQDPLGRLV